MTYAQAIKIIDRIKQSERSAVRTDSKTKLLSHGKKTSNCYVLLHGYTNSPQQYILLAQYLFSAGHNVYIPRLPYHGLKNRLTDDTKKLTEGSLIDSTNQAINIAAGLGKKVTLVGISMGGVMVAWAAQNRADVNHAVLISPAFGFKGVPLWFTDVFVSLSKYFQNAFMWWDPRKKEKLKPDHAYPRFSLYGLGQIFSLGNQALKSVYTKPPHANQITVITSGFDSAIHLPTVDLLAKQWISQNLSVTEFQFPKKLKVWHDMIDPEQSYQQVKITYPVILKLITQ